MSHTRQLIISLAGLMFSLMSVPPTAYAETRLFVPDFRIGAGFDHVRPSSRLQAT